MSIHGLKDKKRAELLQICQIQQQEAVFMAAISRLEAERNAYAKIINMQIPRWLENKLSSEIMQVDTRLMTLHRQREEQINDQ